MKKKLIGFSDELIEQIEEYSSNKEITFTEAVRILVEKGMSPTTEDPQTTPEGGLPTEMDRVLNDLRNLTEQVIKLEENTKHWWNTDETESKIGNLEVTVKDMEKKINVLTKVSKLFKGHIKDREIHLQD